MTKIIRHRKRRGGNILKRIFRSPLAKAGISMLPYGGLINAGKSMIGYGRRTKYRKRGGKRISRKRRGGNIFGRIANRIGNVVKSGYNWAKRTQPASRILASPFAPLINKIPRVGNYIEKGLNLARTAGFGRRRIGRPRIR